MANAFFNVTVLTFFQLLILSPENEVGQNQCLGKRCLTPQGKVVLFFVVDVMIPTMVMWISCILGNMLMNNALVPITFGYLDLEYFIRFQSSWNSIMLLKYFVYLFICRLH